MTGRLPGSAATLSVFALSLTLVPACSVDASGTAADLPFDDAADTASPREDSSIEPLDTIAPIDAAPPLDTAVADTATSLDTSAVDSTPPLDTTPPPPDVPTCDLSACGSPTGAPKRAAIVDSTTACPPGFKSTDVVEPLAGDGCGCSCTAGPGTCSATPAVATFYSDDAACATVGTTLHPSSCTALAGGVDFGGDHFAATVPPPTGTTCTPVKTTNKAAQTRTLHLCEPNPGTCFGGVCGAPFTECLEIGGACPAAYPNARKVGADLNLACPTACTCTTAAGTCGGKIAFFGTTACSGPELAFAVDGTCQAVGGGGGPPTSVRSYTYTPSGPTGASCTPSFFTAPGTPSLTGPRSFCCR